MHFLISEVPLYPHDPRCSHAFYLVSSPGVSNLDETSGLVGGTILEAFPGKRYTGTSPTRKRTALGPYRRHMPRVSRGSEGGGHFLICEAPLYSSTRAYSQPSLAAGVYRGTSLTRNRTALGPYRRHMPMVLKGS